MTIFGKIIRKEIPANIVYEDDEYLVFKDIHPQMTTHLLIIPKKEWIESFHTTLVADRPLVKGLFDVAWKLIDQYGLTGCKLQFNSWKEHGQEVFHIHLHLMSQDSI